MELTLLVLTVGLLGIKTLVRVVDLLLYPIVPFALFVWIWPLFSGELDFSNLFPCGGLISLNTRSRWVWG